MDQCTSFPRKAGHFTLLVFAVIWWGMVSLLDHAILTGVWNQWKAQQTYIAAIATVLSSDVKETDGDEGTSYKPHITYELDVEGTLYRSERTKFAAQPSGRRTARAIVRDHPAGESITVYHDPMNPSRAVIFPEVTGADIAHVVFVIPFNVAGLGMLFTCISGLRSGIQRPAGNTLIADDGVVARLQLSDAKAIYALIGVPGIVCFIGVIVLGLGWGFKPPIEVPLAILGASGTLGVWCAWRTYRAHSRGENELAVDRRVNTITLPRHIAKQVGRDTLPFCAIERVVVETKQPCDDSGSIGQHFVNLETTSEIETRHVTLMLTSNQHRAEGLALWLRNQVGTAR